VSQLEYVIAGSVTGGAVALWLIAFALHQIRDELRKITSPPKSKPEITTVDTPIRWGRR